MQKLVLGLSVAVMLASSPVFAETISGCPVAGVTAGCLVVTAKDGKVYDITEIKDAFDPAKKRGIVASGEVSKDVSTCMQGTILKQIEWTYSEEQCTGGAAE